VFQSFALFASISVAQDIAFGGEMQGMNRKSGGVKWAGGRHDAKRSQPAAAPAFGMRFPAGAGAGCDLL